MNYEQTIELEQNIKIKNEAEEICKDFKKHIKLRACDFVGKSKFKIWSDSNNSIYVQVSEDHFVFSCEFLHERYSLLIKPESLFSQIKQNYRGIEHLKSHINMVKKNE